jgi:hypothetical protein
MLVRRRNSIKHKVKRNGSRGEDAVFLGIGAFALAAADG